MVYCTSFYDLPSDFSELFFIEIVNSKIEFFEVLKKLTLKVTVIKVQHEIKGLKEIYIKDLTKKSNKKRINE